MITEIGATTYQGFPQQQESYLPGINVTYGDSMGVPLISETQNWWDDVSEMGENLWASSGQVGQAIFQATEEAYDKVASAAGRVTRDLSQGIAGATETIIKPVEGVASFAVLHVVLIVGVLGVALYYTGKSGGLRVSV